MEELEHKEPMLPKDPLEEGKTELPVELPKKELPTKVEPEIESKISKQEVLKKIAEIKSPWQVVKNENGEDVIARVEPETQTKESVEEKTKLIFESGQQYSGWTITRTPKGFFQAEKTGIEKKLLGKTLVEMHDWIDRYEWKAGEGEGHIVQPTNK
jgi:hypothetical protein